jgi:hypothetical protein
VTDRLDRVAVNGVELEYELRGTGEPVVLIHWGAGAVWAEPLLDQPALAGGYRLLSYHRAGFAGSSPPAGPATMKAHAAHCHLLMRELGIISVAPSFRPWLRRPRWRQTRAGRAGGASTL